MPEFVKKMLLGTYKEVPYEDDASHIIYSLDEFSVRKDENVQKGYLLGRYGAIPYLKTEEVF